MFKLIIGLIMTTTTTLASGAPETPNEAKLPDYVTWAEEDGMNSVVRKKTIDLNFPLSDEDRRDIKTLEMKFDSEGGCAGLAAPQIGISKRFTIFQAPDNPEWKKWRKDFTQIMPKTIWINPTYEPLSDEMLEDYEACFTLPTIAGPVKRFKKIKYTAYDIDGNFISGSAEGFLARVIQHEIDHLDGILYIDRLDKKDIMDINEYRAKRKKAMEASEEITNE
jgi:peptide deformylase